VGCARIQAKFDRDRAQEELRKAWQCAKKEERRQLLYKHHVNVQDHQLKLGVKTHCVGFNYTNGFDRLRDLRLGKTSPLLPALGSASPGELESDEG
jgi:hypothetical protein